MDLTSLLVLTWLLVVLKSASGIDKELNCAVCRALVDEVNFEIGKVDPKKMIQVGSFRVDPKGNQGTYKKSYARSEIHLLEIFEGVCEKFTKYAESTNSAGKRSVARIEARQDGKALALQNIKINPQGQKEVKFGCEQIVEEHEDDMIALFGKDDIEDMEAAVCGDLTSLCTKEDLAIPMPQTEMDQDEVMATVNANKDKSPSEGEREEPQETKDGMDQELLDQYIKDNVKPDSIPADKVTDTKFTSKDNSEDGKEEL